VEPLVAGQAPEHVLPVDWWFGYSSTDPDDYRELSDWPPEPGVRAAEELRHPGLGLFVVLVFVVAFWSLAGLAVAALF
jgi:hypothetical protein